MPNRSRWLTADLPGTGGTFTPGVDDFQVEELPLYEACGEGEHLYVRFEKRGLTTRDVLRRAIDRLRVPEAEVGYAGLKDKHATTIQTISLPRVPDADAARLDGDGVRVLSARRHKNKLRVGHLAGNRFRVVLRPPAAAAAFTPDDLTRARAILTELTRAGLPNFFGAQRFGVAGDNAALGLAALRRGGRGLPHWKAKFAVSALQSALFNDVLLARLARGDFARVHAGDVLQKVDSGGSFTCTEPAADQPRLDRFEVSLTGPIFGVEMKPATGAPGEWEAAALAAAGLSLDDFAAAKKLAPGTRRALRARVADAHADIADGGAALVLTFTLPPGSYATVLVDEVVKGQPPPDEPSP